MRNNFSQKIKTTLGNRVAWKCSFPGCNELTIGPGNKDANHVLKLGVAAHITAASPLGPRFDPMINDIERSSIKNGIWLCLKHGDLIDKDCTEYSADTLRQWKAQAENFVMQELLSNEEISFNINTLISIGSTIICEAEWHSIKSNEWIFKIKSFIIGNEDLLFEYSMNFNSLDFYNKYLIFEKQGDGRLLEKIELDRINGGLKTTFFVKEKFVAQDPHLEGEDFEIDEDGDLIEGEDGDFKAIRGIGSARQAVRVVLGSKFGDWKENWFIGSNFSEYYKKYKFNHLLLERLLRLEITRLASIPNYERGKSVYKPLLPFIKRILSVQLDDDIFKQEQICLIVRGEWGNGETFTENFLVFVNH